MKTKIKILISSILIGGVIFLGAIIAKACTGSGKTIEMTMIDNAGGYKSSEITAVCSTVTERHTKTGSGYFNTFSAQLFLITDWWKPDALLDTSNKMDSYNSTDSATSGYQYYFKYDGTSLNRFVQFYESYSY